MKKKILIIVIILAVLICGCIAYMVVGGRPVESGNNEEQYINIDQGSSSEQIADKLEDAGLIRSALVFRIKAKMGGDDSKFQAGTYALTKGMTANRIIWLIANGKTAGKSFHVLDRESSDKIAQTLSENDICTEKEFFSECGNGSFDYPFMDILPDGENRFEGFLWPDTYMVSLKAGAHEAIDKMLAGFNENVYQKYKDDIEKKGLDFYDVIIKASVIEGEASDPEDMEKVSSVIDNRIKNGMLLQMDSTLNYIKKEEKVISSLSDTKLESKYNTYKHKGLPPGPICSPGENAIKAAIYPADTDYLFFVNSDKLDGTLTFSKTEAEHYKAQKKFEDAYSEYTKKNNEDQ